MRAHLAVLLVGGLVSVAAPAGAAVRYHLKLAGVEPVAGVPPEVAGRVGDVVDSVVRERKEFVATLDGAPGDPEKLRKWLAARKIHAFEVTVKITSWEREVAPPAPGKSGQVLKVRMTLQLVGTSYPSDALALSGTGASTVMMEVGKTIFPKEESSAADSAVKEATGRALDEAVVRLRASQSKAKTKQK